MRTMTTPRIQSMAGKRACMGRERTWQSSAGGIKNGARASYWKTPPRKRGGAAILRGGFLAALGMTTLRCHPEPRRRRRTPRAESQSVSSLGLEFARRLAMPYRGLVHQHSLEIAKVDGLRQ